jgi:GTP cyclohydrolase I
MALLNAPMPAASSIQTLGPLSSPASPAGSTDCNLPATALVGTRITGGSDDSSQSAGDASAVDGVSLHLASATSSDADNGQSVVALTSEEDEEGTEAPRVTPAAVPQSEPKAKKEGLFLPPSPSAVRSMEKAIETMLREVGEDVERPGLGKSAMRYAAGLLSSTSGYHLPLPSREEALSFLSATAQVAVRSVARGDGTDIRLVTGCFQFNSQCEHHMLPFHGRALIAYTLPATGESMVISKEAMEQVVRVFTRRLQVQERITHQLADATEDLLALQNEGRSECGIMVVCEAVHMCMLARGVENHSGATATLAVRGTFESSPELRMEVLNAFSSL